MTTEYDRLRAEIEAEVRDRIAREEDALSALQARGHNSPALAAKLAAESNEWPTAESVDAFLTRQGIALEQTPTLKPQDDPNSLSSRVADAADGGPAGGFYERLNQAQNTQQIQEALAWADAQAGNAEPAGPAMTAEEFAEALAATNSHEDLRALTSYDPSSGKSFAEYQAWLKKTGIR